MNEIETLGTALPKEIERVKSLIEDYRRLPGGVGLAGVRFIRDDISTALNAITEGDAVKQLRAYQSLKEWQ